VASSAVDRLVGTLESCLEDMEKTDVNELRTFLKTTEPYLHKCHYLRCLAKRYLIQSQGENASLRAQYCQELLALFDSLDGGYSQSRGLTLFEWIRARLEIDKRKATASQSQLVSMVEEVRKCLQVEVKGSHAQKKLIEMEGAINGLLASK